MEDIERFEFEVRFNKNSGAFWCESVEDEHGAWVRYADYVEVVNALRVLLSLMREFNGDKEGE